MRVNGWGHSNIFKRVGYKSVGICPPAKTKVQLPSQLVWLSVCLFKIFELSRPTAQQVIKHTNHRKNLDFHFKLRANATSVSHFIRLSKNVWAYVCYLIRLKTRNEYDLNFIERDEIPRSLHSIVSIYPYPPYWMSLIF